MESPAEDIFSQALELGPGERGDFLDRACAGDSGLRKEVDLLFVDAERADAFFSKAFGERCGIPGRRKFSVENAGDLIGPYKLLEKIGEGGCGVVWMAEQSVPISRRVAIKVIKAGMDTEEILTRFESERQALARMDHTNIARVLDAGATEKGRPYFAMELVNGVPITRFCDERRLDAKARLTLFSDVCAAVNHAHQKGVIHRDIKPSNVLIALDGAKPVVKVIDFGIAKAIEGKLSDRTLWTRLEQSVGTPAYMSPEQAGLAGQDIDTRSDIYALGVLLYELLAGVPPFDPKTLLHAGHDEMRRIIREVEPVKPSVRLTSLSAEERRPIAAARQAAGERMHWSIASDLDWIVMKAIDKSRERRYETADSLAQDIGRFVADKPVEAKPPTPFYLLRKFAKRNRTGLRVVLGFVILLVAATVVSTWLAVRATHAEALAAHRLTDAIEEKDAKDRALQDAEAIGKFLAEVFQRPNPEIDGRTVTVAQALDTATDKLNAELTGQPERLALLQETLAGTYAGLGLFPKSLELRKKVFVARRKSLGVENPATLEALRQLVSTLGVLGFYLEARDLGEEEVAVRRRVNGIDHSATLSAENSLAANYFHSGQHDKAVTMQKDLVDRLLAAYGESDPRSMAAMGVLSNYYRQTGNGKMANEMGLKAAPRASGDAEGKRLTDSEHHAEIKKQLAQMEVELAKVRERNGPDHQETLNFMQNLAKSYYENGYRGDAVRIQEEIVASRRKKYGEEHPVTLEEEDRLAYLLWRDNQWEKATGLKSKLVERRKAIYGPEHVETLTAEADLAGQLFLGGKFDSAQAMAEAAVPLMRKVIGSADRRTLNAISNLARCYAATGRTSDALALLAECSPQMRDDTFVNRLLSHLQLWFGREEEYNKTRRWMIDYAKINRDRFRTRPDILEKVVQIACLAPLENEDQGKELLATLARCQEIRTAGGSPPDRGPGPAWRSLVTGIAYYRAGDDVKADSAFAETARLLDESEKEDKIPRDRSLLNLYCAMSSLRQGNVTV